jgi:hypothetical protein
MIHLSEVSEKRLGLKQPLPFGVAGALLVTVDM